MKKIWLWITGAVFVLLLLLIDPSFVYSSTPNSNISDFESLIGQHGSIMLLIDPETSEIVYANDAAESFYGYSAEKLQTMRLNQINIASVEEIDREIERAENEERNYFLFKHRLANNEIRDVEVYSYPIQTEGRTLLFSVFNDVTEELALKEQLDMNNQRRLMILTFLASVFLLGLMILYFINIQRKRSLRKLDKLNRLQKKLAQTSLNFAHLNPVEYCRRFEEALDAFGLELKADRSFLSMVDLKKESRVKKCSWYRSGIEKDDVAKELDFKNLPWVYSQLKSGRSIYINDVKMLPEKAAAERAYFESRGITAKCLIPLMSGERLIAVWGLDSLSVPVQWEHENEEIRSVLASIFAAGLEREQSRDNLIFWRDLLDYIIQNDPNAIAVLDNDMNYLFASRRYLRDFRIGILDIIGMNHYDIFPDVPERWRKVHQRVLQGHTEKSEDEVFVRQDGSVDYTRYNLMPWYIHEGEVGGIILYLEVINERKKYEIQLKDSEERFRLVVETAPDAIFLLVNDTIVYANPAAADLLKVGHPDALIGESIMSWVHRSYEMLVKMRLGILMEERKPVPPIEQVYVLADGSQVHVEVTSQPIHYQDKNGALVYMRDLTLQKKLEEEKKADEFRIRHQQKLESIGTLASGVAHEINNPIMGIINYAQLIVDENVDNENVATFANEIITESNRISDISKNLLFYSRQQKQTHSPADINDLIRRTLALINGVMKKDQIEVTVVSDDSIPLVKCRSQQIQQILMNLLTNARDALNEKYQAGDPDKVIIISTYVYEEKGRRWIRISVEDHGNGIPKDIQEKLFDPFFTTKSRDVGTGLGLPISYGLALDHHGRLEFETVEGEYTKFHLIIPVDNGWDMTEGE